MHGDSAQAAGEYVIKYHLDYLNRSRLMKIANRFIPFPLWRLGAPKMIVGAMLERPRLFATTSKLMEEWNTLNPQREQMTRYMQAEYPGRFMLFVPYSDDAYAVMPFSIEEISKLPALLDSQNFQFYWQEAVKNPNILLKFAKYNLGVEWLLRGGGVPEVKGKDIVITYRHTGETITARLTGNNTLAFIDGNGNGTRIIGEYPISDKGDGRLAIMSEVAPWKKLLSRYTRGYVTAPFEFIEERDYRTGQPIEDWGAWFKNKGGLSSINNFLTIWSKQDISNAEKISEGVFSISILHARNVLGLTTQAEEQIVKKELRNVRRNYRGCG
jgi:hypothetical protein